MSRTIEAKEWGAERRPQARSGSGENATLANAAYERLRDDILAAVLAPNERLRTQDLKRRYGFGTAPLREALVRLHGEQLVGGEGHRGYWVSPVSVEELRDLTRTRVLLDAEALRGSIANGRDEWEAGMLSTFHFLERSTARGDHLDEATLPEWEFRHEAFHAALVAGDGSRLLLRLRTTLALLVGRYRRYALAAADDRQHVEEHRGIMTAALDRDPDSAIRLLSEHYELTTRTILDNFEAKPR